jgi:hypothetical protein
MANHTGSRALYVASGLVLGVAAVQLVVAMGISIPPPPASSEGGLWAALICPVFRHRHIKMVVDVGEDLPEVRQRSSGDKEKSKTQASRRTNR